ncbi:MAG: radical SAM protein [Candidatus Pacebacteria bacterium]|nr:radical SAM protein [Candidatus Paceibacterota bacterium]
MKRSEAIGKDIWLIEGSARWAIYDIQKGTIIQVTKEGGLFLLNLLKNDENFRVKREILLEKDPHLFRILNSEGCLDRMFRNYSRIPINYGHNCMLWIEVTDVCNQFCLHCYTSSNKRGSFLEKRKLEEIIHQASELEFEQVQFTGGEPLLYPKIWEIIEYVRRFYTIHVVELYTNLTLLQDEDIELLKKYQVKIATTLLGSCADIHDYCTGVSGSFDLLLRNLRKIRDKEIEFRIGVIRLAENQNDMESIERLIRQEKFISPIESFSPDDVRLVGRGSKCVDLSSDQTWQPYFHINPEYFHMAHYWNTCWGGELAITSKGEVLPCIFARKQVLGNIYSQNLKQIIKSPKTQRLWKITSDKIEKCRDCEYRYACMDCRVLSVEAGRGLFGKPTKCNYDPYH